MQRVPVRCCRMTAPMVALDRLLNAPAMVPATAVIMKISVKMPWSRNAPPD